MKHAAKEESFAAIVGAAIALVLTGTVAYTLGEGWSLSDGFYFAVATLTTSSIADRDLVLTDGVLKIFTTIYILLGIGILVEVARQLGVGFVRMHEDQTAARHAKRQDRRERRHKDESPEAQPPG